MKFGFENLTVWHKALSFAECAYILIEDFPKTEQFGLSSQMKRATVSILSNIAEGNSRFSKKEQARFFEISFGSSNELLAQFILSNKLGFISDQQLNELQPKIREVSVILNALHKSKR